MASLDTVFTQLNIVSSETGAAMGVINWFAVHATSMNGSNTLISSDNKGAASIMMEKHINGKDRRIGTGPFVAAFASSNLGDVSPNTKGPRCLNTGLPCDIITSTCNGRNAECVAFGPGEDMFESTEIIAAKQYRKALELFSNHYLQKEVVGVIDSSHQWINMAKQVIPILDANGHYSQVKTCSPALGYAFAAGTTDGPGEVGFAQGTPEIDIFWQRLLKLMKDPTPEEKTCHAPKPILLNTGDMKFPFDWSPEIIDTQMLRLGQFLIIAAPGEFTTMAGRRMRETVFKEAIAHGAGIHETKVAFTGLSNVYGHYVTTFEEYQLQRYEAGVTIYGPYTLDAYLLQYRKLTRALFSNMDSTLSPGIPPPDMMKKQISFKPGVMMDSAPMYKSFGDCTQQPVSLVIRGDVVKAKFVSGHPRNNLMLERTFLLIEKQLPDGQWVEIASDANWETKFIWRRTVLAQSEAEILWHVPQNQELGTYRIVHFGYAKLLGKRRPQPYKGMSNTFKVVETLSNTYEEIPRNFDSVNKSAKRDMFAPIKRFFKLVRKQFG